MGQCCSNKSKEDPLVDVERLLQDFVWRWTSSLSWWRRHFRSRCLIEVNWSHVDISHELIEFTAKDDENVDKKLPSAKAKSGKKTKKHNKKQQKLKSRMGKTVVRDLCLFRTEFTNDTPTKQTYTFHTDRKTRSVCSVQVQKGFRVGAKLDVKFGIPMVGVASGGALDAFDVTGGLSSQFHVTKTDGQQFEEELSWGVNSQVTVKSGQRTTASLVVQEKEFTAAFRIRHHIRPSKDGVSIYIRRRRTNEIITTAQIPAQCFASVFEGKNAFNKVNDREVWCETQGTCSAVYGAQQTIRIEAMKSAKGHKRSNCPTMEGPPSDNGGEDMELDSDEDSSSEEEEEEDEDDEEEMKIQDVTASSGTGEKIPMLEM